MQGLSQSPALSKTRLTWSCCLLALAGAVSI